MKIFELVQPAEVIELERQLDKLMRPVGLDVEFTRHFVERLLGRERRVTIEEVVAAFKKLKAKFKRRLLSAKKKPNYEAVLKDFGSDLNIVFGIKGNQLNNITIKRKNPDSFHPNAKGGEELKVQ